MTKLDQSQEILAIANVSKVLGLKLIRDFLVAATGRKQLEVRGSLLKLVLLRGIKPETDSDERGKKFVQVSCQFQSSFLLIISLS